MPHTNLAIAEFDNPPGTTLCWLGRQRIPILRMRDRLIPWQIRHTYYRHKPEAGLGLRFSAAVALAHVGTFVVHTFAALFAMPVTPPLDTIQTLAILIPGLKSYSRSLHLSHGKRLYLAGQPANEVMLLSDGYGRLCIEQEEGRSMTVGLVAPGDLFGEEALLDEPVRESAFEAVLESQVEVVSREDFTRLLRDNPPLMWSITGHLAQQLLAQQHHMARLAFEPLEQRLAWILLELAHATTRLGETVAIIPIYHKDLAALLGVWRETITATLNRWSSNGLIEQRAGHIMLKDVERLQEMAEG